MQKSAIWILAGLIVLLVAAGLLWTMRVEKPSSSVKVNEETGAQNFLDYIRDRGESELKEKRYHSQIRIYEKLLSVSPDSIETKKQLAFAYFGVGRYDDAFPLLAQVARTSSADAETYYELGFIALKRGDVKSAKEDLEHAVKLDPEHADARELLGKLE